MGLKIRQSSSHRGGPLVSVCQAAADFLPDYFRAALLLSGHIQANRASLSLQQGWAADMYAPTHTHPQLTHLMPN